MKSISEITKLIRVWMENPNPESLFQRRWAVALAITLLKKPQEYTLLRDYALEKMEGLTQYEFLDAILFVRNAGYAKVFTDNPSLVFYYPASDTEKEEVSLASLSVAVAMVDALSKSKDADFPQRKALQLFPLKFMTKKFLDIEDNDELRELANFEQPFRFYQETLHLFHSSHQSSDEFFFSPIFFALFKRWVLRKGSGTEILQSPELFFGNGTHFFYDAFLPAFPSLLDFYNASWEENKAIPEGERKSAAELAYLLFIEYFGRANRSSDMRDPSFPRIHTNDAVRREIVDEEAPIDFSAVWLGKSSGPTQTWESFEADIVSKNETDKRPWEVDAGIVDHLYARYFLPVLRTIFSGNVDSIADIQTALPSHSNPRQNARLVFQHISTLLTGSLPSIFQGEFSGFEAPISEVEESPILVIESLDQPYLYFGNSANWREAIEAEATKESDPEILKIIVRYELDDDEPEIDW